VWGWVVLSDDPWCLVEETGWVEIIDGPKAGERSGATCAYDDPGYRLYPPFGQVVTLRASKPGYRSQERQLMVVNGGAPTIFTLQKE
jgi:hypothetical protein